MAEIRKIVRSAPLSNFSRVAPDGGSGFAAIAAMAQEAYDFLEPIAMEREAQRGDEDAGQNRAQRILGDNRIPVAPQAAPRSPLGNPNEPPTAQSGAAPSITTSPLPPSLLSTESGGDLGALNDLGYGGRGQFGDARLEDAFRAGAIDRLVTGAEYSRLPEPMQRRVEQWHVNDILDFVQRNGLDQYIGQQINGVTVTPDGLVAVAHLGGTDGLRRYLTSGGRYNPADANGTSLANYMRTHQGDYVLRGGSGADTLSGPAGGPVPPTMAMDPSLPGDVRNALFPPTQVGPQVQGGYEGLVPASTAPVPAPQAPAPTLIRNGEGRLEARLYSPAAGPIRQAYNAAYMARTLAETGMASQADLMSLSQQHADDPEGFLAAARQYSDQTAANTDPRLRRDVRAQMDEEINRRYLGMLDQQYRTTQARAEDALSAQAEMWSQDYAAAIASGNADEIARTQARLQSVLAAREAMPGSTWSPERSQLFMRNAQQAGQRQIEQQREQRAGEYRDSLRTIIAARRDGLTAADETVLSDPAAWAADPALAQEAAAWIEFRDQFPAFEGLPPAQQQAVIADLRAQPVQDEYQIAMIGKAEEAASAGQRAWAEDPIARAAEVLPTAPPPIPAYDPANPQAMMNALTARAEYANGLVQQGYVARPTFFSRAEADDLSLAMGKDMPDEVRLALAQAVALGLGDNAIFAFDQLNLDPVLGHSGRMLASGGDAATAMEALRGQRMLDEGLVSIPAALTRIDAVAPEISEALSGIPANDVEMLSSITAYAQAIYAANARGVDPDSQQAKDLMATAIQRAMGQSEDANGRTTGGVQRVLNGSVWLPVGMSGDLVNERLRDMVPPSGLGAGFQDMAEAFNDSRDVRLARWRASQPEGIAPSLPYVGTQPMPPGLLRSARLVPVGGENGSVYRMEIVRSGTVLDVVTESGDIFYLDLKRMMEAP